MGDQLDQFHILPNVMLFCVRHTFKHLLLRPCIPPPSRKASKGRNKLQQRKNIISLCLL